VNLKERGKEPEPEPLKQEALVTAVAAVTNQIANKVIDDPYNEAETFEEVK